MVLVVSAALPGCGGGKAKDEGTASPPRDPNEVPAPTMAVNQSGGESVQAWFGPPGGKLELSNGWRVEIPPGTVVEATEVVLKNAPPTTVFKDEDVQGRRPVGPIVLVTPDLYAPEGRWFTLSIPFAAIPEGYTAENLLLAYEEPADEQRAFAEDTTVTRWNYENTEVRDGRAWAQMAVLPGMRLQFVLSRD
jgi:hypothetical protein